MLGFCKKFTNDDRLKVAYFNMHICTKLYQVDIFSYDLNDNTVNYFTAHQVFKVYLQRPAYAIDGECFPEADDFKVDFCIYISKDTCYYPKRFLQQNSEKFTGQEKRDQNIVAFKALSRV